jgi:DNA-binding transcriptional LysR family regulator
LRLPKIDLNLFVVFDAIHSERNLTRAARVLFITQPAVSNALKRLRLVFDDPLFVRTPHGVSPTPLAENISGGVKEALKLLNISLTESETFDPVSSEKSFSISVHDYDEIILIPKLMAHLAEVAPLVSVEFFSVPRKDLENELASGSLDFALDIPLFSTPQLCRQQRNSDPYVCMVRPDHPTVGENLSLEQYLELDHIHVSSRRRGVGHIERALDRIGRQRNIQLRIKNYLTGPLVVASTNLAITIPSNVASLYDMKTVELPFVVETLDQFLYWHKSADQDRANVWMRSILLQQFK